MADVEEGDSAPLAAWEARHAAHLAEVAATAGFDQREDHAALIVRFMVAYRDRHHPDHDHRVLGRLLKRANARYVELRMHDFDLAQRVAMTEAVRAILALPLPEPSK